MNIGKINFSAWSHLPWLLRPSLARPAFKMHFGTLHDVTTLQDYEAVLLHKSIVGGFKDVLSAKAAIRVNGRKHGLYFWITTTKRGHLLVWRKPTRV